MKSHLLTQEQNDAFVGKATCGCTYSAEEGIACVHDIALAIKEGKITAQQVIAQSDVVSCDGLCYDRTGKTCNFCNIEIDNAAESIATGSEVG
jgi:hypothetical protein